MKLPEKYINEMAALLGEQLDAYLEAMDQEPFSCIRVNTSKISTEEFMKISPFELKTVPWCKEGFYVDRSVRPGTHPYYYGGLYYIQEPSAMAPAAILDACEGDVILDACAAPGGKSTALGAKLNGTGLLVSNDISASRQNATLKNLERFGITQCYVTAQDLNDLKSRYPESFDRILVDAPCSGEGMFRKEPSLINAWLEKDSYFYAPLQKEILNNAWSMLKPGGSLAYSTCTFAIEEDEDVIRDLMEKHDDVILEESPLSEYFEPGVRPGFEACMRLYPHKVDGEGHFCALLKKKGNSEKTVPSVSNKPLKHPGFEAFMKHVTSPSEGSYTMIKDRIIRLPDLPFDNTGVRTVRGGLLMGTVKNDRFEPSAPLALSLKAEQFDNVLSLPADDIRTEKYLRGETIRDENTKDGWVLVCVDGYPLGFGKCSSHSIKNKLDKGYRKI